MNYRQHEKKPIEIQYPAQILTEFRITIIILGFHCGLTGVSGMEKCLFLVTVQSYKILALLSISSLKVLLSFKENNN